MANFIKCKQESFSYKKYENVKVRDELTRSFFFFVKINPIYEFQEEVEAITVYNNPINIEYVKNISRTGGIYCGLSKFSAHYGIRFFLVGGGESCWFYDNVKTRDEQFEEIVSNNHLYKSKVNI